MFSKEMDINVILLQEVIVRFTMINIRVITFQLSFTDIVL